MTISNTSQPLFDATTASNTTSTTPETLAMAALSKLLQLTPTGPPGWGTMFKFFFVLMALINIKNIPLTWHFRFYRSLFHHLLRRRSLHPTTSHLFSPISSTSRSPLYECDLNLHKSNSTYFSDLDIARTHLICHLIKRSLRTRRSLYVALAGVSCLFRREIKPFEKYEIVSRLLGWDGKWVWVVSHFVSIRKDKDGSRKIFASALSKYVFKMGRITVKPEEIFTECQLLPPRPVEAAVSTTSGALVANGNGSGNGEIKKLANGAAAHKSEKEVLAQLDAATATAETHPDAYWTWERIEAERARGCEIAKSMLGLDQLEGEIRSGDEEGLTKVGRFY
ncbi:uncharacterized protein H6S33_010363 [Morchella sextelata]|uniref:uncharacterized protein n=1 Tax=Morchella sextelata TaxID=1174677 RepID=UPI001D045E34|nr:uncharacterized protein H6S33_010363 [Morchella sextelata]KAH0612311.1 hypothetical protein H6S33_010363 [Morchella sextelata]